MALSRTIIRNACYTLLLVGASFLLPERATAACADGSCWESAGCVSAAVLPEMHSICASTAPSGCEYNSFTEQYVEACGSQTPHSVGCSYRGENCDCSGGTIIPDGGE
jgi:hypothetical protein